MYKSNAHTAQWDSLVRQRIEAVAYTTRKMWRLFHVALVLVAYSAPLRADFLLYTPDKLLESLQVRSAILRDQMLRIQAEPPSEQNQEILQDLARRVNELQLQIVTLSNFANNADMADKISVARTAATTIDAQQTAAAAAAAHNLPEQVFDAVLGEPAISNAQTQRPTSVTTTGQSTEQDMDIEELLEMLVKQRDQLDTLIKKVQAQIVRDLAS